MTQAPVEHASQAGELPPNWKPDTSAFGARLALVRWRLSQNLAEAARACGIAVETWRAWETDGRMPRDLYAVTKQIAESTGCDHTWLMVGEEAAAA